MSNPKLITIDGPAASGKSSVSRMLAKKLGWPWVSTGAFYRGLALAVLEKGLDESNESALVELAQSNEWRVEMAENTQVWFGDQDRTQDIAGEKVGAVASRISQNQQVRQALRQRQRDCFVADRGLVAEGRDCGTVVFPQAAAKVYLTASPATRALRRSGEDEQDLAETLKLQEKRDAMDSQRKTSPLKVADGALQVDSSFLSLEEVVEEVFKYAEKQKVPIS